MKKLPLFVLGFALIAAITIFDGYVLSKLWTWFMVPHFNLPGLTIPTAIGLTAIAHFLTHQYDFGKTKHNQSYEEIISKMLLTGLFTLFFLVFGWITAQFM